MHPLLIRHPSTDISHLLKRITSARQRPRAKQQAKQNPRQVGPCPPATGSSSPTNGYRWKWTVSLCFQHAIKERRCCRVHGVVNYWLYNSVHGLGVVAKQRIVVLAHVIVFASHCI
ncbi:hypothetical protein NHJ13051_008673 [Beauveria bassiana]